MVKFMMQKLLLVAILIVGALLTYMAELISRYVRIGKTKESNIIIIKSIGFIIVFAAVIITFVKF